MWILISYSIFLLGCSPEEQSPESTIPETVRAESVIATPSPSETTEKPEKKEPLKPLEGKTLKEICSSLYLPLLKWRYAELQSNFTKLCCSKEGLNGEPPCGLDWPFSDVPSCEAYDDLRNGIYALYGYQFTKKKWQIHFTEKNWYQPREDYSESWIAAAAMENIATLQRLKEAKVNCSD